MEARKYKLIAIFAASLAVTGWVAADAAAEEAGWIVASVDGGAWRSTDRDPSVRTALHPGDVVGPHDRIETFHSNSVTLAKDPSGENIVTVEGSFQVLQLPNATRVRLDRGQALAVLDGLHGKGDFSISTPAGVAVVRGTRFLVVSDPIKGMEVQTYRGEVAVRPAESRSKHYAATIPLPKGRKTAVGSAASTSEAGSDDLSAADWKRYRESFAGVEEARSALQQNGSRWFEESQKPSRSRSVAGGNDRDRSSETEGRSILF